MACLFNTPVPEVYGSEVKPTGHTSEPEVNPRRRHLSQRYREPNRLVDVLLDEGRAHRVGPRVGRTIT